MLGVVQTFMGIFNAPDSSLRLVAAKEIKENTSYLCVIKIYDYLNNNMDVCGILHA